MIATAAKDATRIEENIKRAGERDQKAVLEAQAPASNGLKMKDRR